MSVAEAFSRLEEALGARMTHLSVPEAARRLDVSPDWIKKHQEEFPHRWRLPAGAAATSTGARNVGELRIPVTDVEALAERMRIER
jgi:hypothetical protein